MASHPPDPPAGARIDHVALSVRDLDRTIAWREQWNTPGLRHLCFPVDGREEALAELRRRGLAPPPGFGDLVDVPEIGVRIAFVQDPEGTVIELMEQVGEPDPARVQTG